MEKYFYTRMGTFEIFIVDLVIINYPPFETMNILTTSTNNNNNNNNSTFHWEKKQEKSGRKKKILFNCVAYPMKVHKIFIIHYSEQVNRCVDTISYGRDVNPLNGNERIWSAAHCMCILLVPHKTIFKDS